jgi:hypothetical protein
VINIFTNDLPKNSIFKVAVECDNCGCVKNIQYRNYLKGVEKYDKYYCNRCCYKKSEMTYMEKNSIKCIFFDEEFINLNKKTNKKKREIREIINNKSKSENKIKALELKKNKFIEKSILVHKEKYDYSLVQYINNKTKVRIKCNVCDSIFFQSPSNHVNHKQNCSYCGGKYKDNSDFKIYRNSVRNETYKYKKILLDNWNGYDFYDSEFIKDNFSLNCYDNNYPSVDHKISIKFGFDNDMSVEKIGNIDNLCITKRIINIKKSSKIYV